jgi:hypothetical protein
VFVAYELYLNTGVVHWSFINSRFNFSCLLLNIGHVRESLTTVQNVPGLAGTATEICCTASCYVRRGRAIAQAISCRLPTAAVRARARLRSCGICGGQSGAGAGFLLVLRFPLPILITPTAPHSSSSIIRGWYNRPNSRRRTKWTQSHPIPKRSYV